MKLFPLFSANKLKAIPVVEKIGGEVIFISEAEFQQKFACEYTESIWATEDLASYYSDIQQASKKSQKKLTKDEKKLKHRLENPLEDIAITFMGEKVGYGLVARKDIEPGTIIGVYSGVQEKEEGYKSGDDYLHRLDNDICVNARIKGGIIRFMQHLPDELEDDELANIEFKSPSIKASIAKSNIIRKSGFLFGCPMTVFVAERLIKAGEQLGYSYEEDYWRIKRVFPEYFLNDLTILDHSQYKRKKAKLNFDHPIKKGKNIEIVVDSNVNDIDLTINSECISLEFDNDEKIKLSVYDFRSRLSDGNIVDGQRYAALPQVDKFIESLNNMLKIRFTSITVREYYKFPNKTDELGKVIDSVFRVANSRQLSQLERFFKPIEDIFSFYHETNEMVLVGRNVLSAHKKIVEFVSTADFKTFLSENWDKLYLKAIECFQKDNFTEAIQWLNKAIQECDDDSENQAICFYHLAKSHVRIQQYDKATSMVEKSIKLFAALTGEVVSCKEKLIQAEELFSQIKSLQKSEKYAQLALKFFKSENFNEAKSNFILSIKLHQEVEFFSERLGTYYYNLASSCDRLNELHEAIKYCESALNIREKLFGFDNPQTRSARDKLDKLQEKLKKSEAIVEFSI